VPGGLAVTYLGWSGFRIERAPHRVFVDPPEGTPFPADGHLTILLSHGHPEHVGGTRALVGQAERRVRITIAASPAICRHLARVSGRGVSFLPTRPGARLRLDEGLEVRVFEWTHLPLLPGGLKANLAHIRHLLSRPDLAWRIARAGLAGPPAGPMLGFGITLGDRSLLAWGEGLHRFAAPWADPMPPAIVLAAVEPGDEAAIPGLLRACGADAALLFEPHARWRDAFGMERADLEGLRARLERDGTRAVVVQPGQTESFPRPA